MGTARNTARRPCETIFCCGQAFQKRGHMQRWSETGYACFTQNHLIAEVDGMVSGRVDIFCSGGLRFLTDHRYHLRAGDRLNEEPVMYIGMDSHGLVQAAPRVSGDAMLDLCCGSGIQGIIASRYANTVTAVDINPRAVRFARFNAQFNGVEKL